MSKLMPTKGSLVVFVGYHREYSWSLAYASPNKTTLTVDEPSLFLHPHRQRLLARALAVAVNRGRIVTVGTHSDYVIRELSNLVRLGEAGEAGLTLARKMGLREEHLLLASKVDVYEFYSLRGSIAGTCSSVIVDKDGFTIKSIDKVIDAQNTMSQDITFNSYSGDDD